MIAIQIGLRFLVRLFSFIIRLLAAAFVQVVLKPFTLPEINRLEFCSLLASSVTFWAGQLLFVAVPYATRMFASFLIFAVNVVFGLYALYLFVRSLQLDWANISAMLCCRQQQQPDSAKPQSKSVVEAGPGLCAFCFVLVVCFYQLSMCFQQRTKRYAWLKCLQLFLPHRSDRFSFVS